MSERDGDAQEQLIDGVPVRLLTLRRPWPRMFDPDVGKTVENRPWRTRKLPIWLALHAGQGWDAQAAESIKAGNFGPEAQLAMLLSPRRSEHPHGVITHLAYCSGCVEYAEYLVTPRGIPPRTPGERPAHNRSLLDAALDQWAFGPYCWTLSSVIKLREPVPCKGGQGLRRLPPDVFEAVLACYNGSNA